MRLKEFCEWLGKESVNMELKKKGEVADEFIRIVKAFYRYLNKEEKKQLKKRIPNIENNIEYMYDKIVYDDMKKAVKEVRANGNEKNKLAKLKSLGKIMDELDDLYGYALGFIGTQVVHNLGYKKEKFKQTIEDAII